jgi:predicted dehydrogenase
MPEELNNTIAIFKGSFVYFARAIVQSILTADKSSIEAAATLEDAVATQTVLDAMLTSANTGEKVALVPGWRPTTHLI